MSDLIAELLLRIRRGDESAFSELSEKYAGMTEKAVRRFAPSFGIADGADSVMELDDLRQCAYMALYRAASNYRSDEEGKSVSFGLYSKICVNNALISELRRHESKKRRALRAIKNELRPSKRASDPLFAIMSAENTADLMTLIEENLSVYEKKVFDLYIDGKSVSQISKILSKEEKSVSNAIYRLKAKLKSRVKDQ